MGEGEEVVGVTWWWAVVCAVLVVGALGIAVLFHLKDEAVGAEIFAALCDAVVGVFLVGGGLTLHRRSLATKRKNVGIVRALIRATADSENALMLMRAHMSARTWKEQLQTLKLVKNELLTLADEMEENSKREAAVHTRRAIDIIDALANEYENRQIDVAPIQDEFETLHKADPKMKAAKRPDHWRDVLNHLPTLSTVLDKEKSELLHSLRLSITLMRK
jgi:hypothetical protein